MRAETHKAIQDRLPVSLILTPVDQLVTCHLDETTKEAAKKGQPDDFDFLPVTSSNSEIVGLFKCKTSMSSEARVGDVYEKLNVNMLIGGDASIIDFASTAHQSPFRFVVSKAGLAGIVTISDLQQFPARSSLFTLIMDFELLLAEVIENRLGNRIEDWSAHLDKNSLAQTNNYVSRAKKESRYVNDLLVTSLEAKVQIIHSLSHPRGVDLARLQEPLIWLRNRLAHADEIACADLPLSKVSATMSELLECRSLLLSEFEEA